jgi:hypothetical protein
MQLLGVSTVLGSIDLTIDLIRRQFKPTREPSSDDQGLRWRQVDSLPRIA